MSKSLIFSSKTELLHISVYYVAELCYELLHSQIIKENSGRLNLSENF